MASGEITHELVHGSSYLREAPGAETPGASRLAIQLCP